jgi:hypothetical protein
VSDDKKKDAKQIERESIYRDVLMALRTNQFRVSGHANYRMQTRNVIREDIICLGSNGLVSPGKDSDFNVCGKDCDGDELEVAVGIEDGFIIVTVF